MKRYILTLIIIATALHTIAQSRNAKYEAYIEKYSAMAIECQAAHKIPASITLAQGLLESAAGTSRLAVECNNHFGIKCGSSWYGRTMRLDDDARNECFRCYASAKESFDDHADFLKRQRYSFLFDYDITDYKSWAKGLKTAGYATDPNYANKLIGIIETYNLSQYDTQTTARSEKIAERANKKQRKENSKPTDTDKLFDYVEITNNGVRCFKLIGEDSFENISKATGISVKRLLYYNDLPESVDLFRGDYVYLAPKRSQAKNERRYIVKAGDSMHSIAQEYGIKLKSLYRLNDLEYGTPAEVGMKLKLHR